jgi:hypothetical protein
MSDQLQPQSGSHGTPPPAAIVDGAAKPLPRRSPTPNERARTDALPPSNEAPGLSEEADGAQDASGAAAGGDQDREPPADATTEGRPEDDLVPVVGPELEDSAPAAAPAAPIAVLPVVGPAKSGGAPHARPVISARGPWERNRREAKILQKHILEPEDCPFIQQSAKYTLAFGPDPCRNKILALFEFWANKLPKEDGGVVSIEASYARICQGLFFEFSRHEISKAIDSLHDDGLITRPDHGHQVIRQKNGVDRKKRRSTGGKDVLTFHVDTINERIRDDAIAGTDGYGFGDWMNLLRKRFPREYHGAAHHPGTFNQCKACTGWPKDNGSDQTDNQGTAYAGSPDNQGTAYAGTSGSNQGTAYPGARAPGALVEAQTRVPGALHKRSKEGKEEETTTSFPSSSNTENLHTVTEPPVQVGAPTPNPRGEAPLPPPAEELENELQGSYDGAVDPSAALAAAALAAKSIVDEILEAYPDKLNRTHHAGLISKQCDDPTFAKDCRSLLGRASRMKNERIKNPVLWAIRNGKDGVAGWLKIHEGRMDAWIEPESPVQSLAQDVTVKVGKTPAQRFDSDRMHVESRARQYRIPERFPAVWEEWRRRFKRWCADKDNPNFDDIRWLEEQIEPLVAEQQVMKRMPDSMRDERYRGWGEAELMAAFGGVLGRTEAI